MNLNNIMNTLNLTKQQSKKLVDEINLLNHNDMGVRNFINRVKKLSLQSLDVLNEMDRQLHFLINETKGYDTRKNMEKQRSKIK